MSSEIKLHHKVIGTGIIALSFGAGWSLAVWSTLSIGPVPVVGTLLLVLAFLTNGFTFFKFDNVGYFFILVLTPLGWRIALANGFALAINLAFLRAELTGARSTVLLSVGALYFFAGAAWVLRARKRVWRNRQAPRAQPKAHHDVESAAATRWQQMDIILLTVSEVRHLQDALWISGKGYALFDSGKGGFMWRSTTPPQIEITIRSSDPHRPTCETLLARGLPSGKVLSLKGAGSFRSPLLALDSVTQCAVVDAS